MQPDAQAALAEQVDAEGRLWKQNPQRLREVLAQKILGHSSVAVTEAHYAHLLKEDLVAASRQVKRPIAKRSNSNVVPIGNRRA